MYDFNKYNSKVPFVLAGGFICDTLFKNVELWQVNSVKDNVNIFNVISDAKKYKQSLDCYTSPVWWHMKDYLLSNVEFINGKNQLVLSLQEIPEKFDLRDFVFCFDKNAICDFTGAKEIIIKIDSSCFDNPVWLFFGIETSENSNGYFSVESASNVKLISVSGETNFTECDAQGFIKIPSKFIGEIKIQISQLKFNAKNCEQELKNCAPNLSCVTTFKLALKGDNGAIGKLLYVQSFNILAFDNKINGYKVKKVWDFENVQKKVGYREQMLPWYGEFAGKLLTGLVLSYRLFPVDHLRDVIVKAVKNFANVQDTDGYLGTYVGCSRYSLYTDNWDTWNQYHAIIGLIEWYKISGDPLSYSVAKKALDCIIKTFKNRSYIVNGGFETNRSIAHAFAEFYTISGEIIYLNEAKRIIDFDCQEINGWYKIALNGGSFYTACQNRWEVLHTVMALGILYRETNNKQYLTVLKNVWEDICKLDVHNTGGFTTNEGAKGNPYLLKLAVLLRGWR